MESGADTLDPAVPSAPPLSIDELLHAAAFPHEVTGLVLKETHVSWVILTGPFAYKIKKPLKLEFCDASTLDRRRFLCEEELRLNRRLAASLYVDVVPITRGENGVRIEGRDSLIDYAVRMRQFDTTQELDALLARREVSGADIGRLADRLAAFHAAAPRSPGPDAFDYVARFRRLAVRSMALLLEHLGSIAPSAEVTRAATGFSALLLRREPELRERHAAGFIRECHGDLHARNIVRWQGELTPFDCLEFDLELRQIDVMNDLAFLAMDLLAHGRTDLACTLLSRYAERTGDYHGLRVWPLYAIDRALVRAMVDGVAGEQHPDRQNDFAARQQARISTALKLLEPKPPALCIMHGPSGSGKSYVSERLVPLLGAVRIRSDLERKRLAGLDAAAHAPAQVYSPAWNARIYGHLATCAESCLAAGLSAVVDAAFLDPAERREFHALARRRCARFAIVSCRAGRRELEERITARSRGEADPSDATLAVLEAQLERLTPLGDDERGFAVHIDTTQAHPERSALAALQALLTG